MDHEAIVCAGARVLHWIPVRRAPAARLDEDDGVGTALLPRANDGVGG